MAGHPPTTSAVAALGQSVGVFDDALGRPPFLVPAPTAFIAAATDLVVQSRAACGDDANPLDPIAAAAFSLTESSGAGRAAAADPRISRTLPILFCAYLKGVDGDLPDRNVMRCVAAVLCAVGPVFAHPVGDLLEALRKHLPDDGLTVTAHARLGALSDVIVRNLLRLPPPPDTNTSTKRKGKGSREPAAELLPPPPPCVLQAVCLSNLSQDSRSAVAQRVGSTELWSTAVKGSLGCAAAVLDALDGNIFARVAPPAFLPACVSPSEDPLTDAMSESLQQFYGSGDGVPLTFDVLGSDVSASHLLSRVCDDIHSVLFATTTSPSQVFENRVASAIKNALTAARDRAKKAKTKGPKPSADDVLPDAASALQRNDGPWVGRGLLLGWLCLEAHRLGFPVPCDAAVTLWCVCALTSATNPTVLSLSSALVSISAPVDPTVVDALLTTLDTAALELLVKAQFRSCDSKPALLRHVVSLWAAWCSVALEQGVDQRWPERWNVAQNALWAAIHRHDPSTLAVRGVAGAAATILNAVAPIPLQPDSRLLTALLRAKTWGSAAFLQRLAGVTELSKPVAIAAGEALAGAIAAITSSADAARVAALHRFVRACAASALTMPQESETFLSLSSHCPHAALTQYAATSAGADGELQQLLDRLLLAQASATEKAKAIRAEQRVVAAAALRERLAAENERQRAVAAECAAARRAQAARADADRILRARVADVVASRTATAEKNEQLRADAARERLAASERAASQKGEAAKAKAALSHQRQQERLVRQTTNEHFLRSLGVEPEKAKSIALTFFRQTVTPRELLAYLVTGKIETAADVGPQRAAGSGRRVVTFSEDGFWDDVEDMARQLNQPVGMEGDGELDAPDPQAEARCSFHRRIAIVLDVFDLDLLASDDSSVRRVDPVPSSAFAQLRTVQSARRLGWEDVGHALYVAEQKGLVSRSDGMVYLTPLGCLYHYGSHDPTASFRRATEASAANLRQRLAAATAERDSETASERAEDEVIIGDEIM